MKKIISVLFIFLFATMIFAQAVESAGITDKDVKNYAKNYKQILKILDSANDDFDAVRINVELEKIGISGPNSVYKVTIITNYAVAAYQQYSIENNPTLANMYAAMGVNVSDISADKNKHDYDIVYANIELIIEAMNN